MKRILITGGSGFIGTNLIQFFSQRGGIELLNLDVRPPLNQNYRYFWKSVDILSANQIKTIMQEFKPEVVIHLAARTDMYGKTLDDYRINSDGTRNILEAVKSCLNVERVVITSTQYVCQPRFSPKSDDDYFPHTLYGESKALAEQYTRSADLDCIWTIIRPTNIWGPYHPRYPYEFWKVLSKGYYFHPTGKQPIRCYGYVENVTWQIARILEASPELVHRKTFYVGDRPISLDKWVDGFARALTGKEARRISPVLLRAIAWLGDLCGLFGVRFPITSTRFRSMTEDYIVNMNPIFDLFGEPPISLEEGIRKTAKWLQRDGHVKRIFVD